MNQERGGKRGNFTKKQSELSQRETRQLAPTKREHTVEEDDCEKENKGNEQPRAKETQAQDLIIKNKKSVALLQEKARLETPSPPRTMKNSDTISGDPKMIEVTPDQVRQHRLVGSLLSDEPDPTPVSSFFSDTSQITKSKQVSDSRIQRKPKNQNKVQGSSLVNDPQRREIVLQLLAQKGVPRKVPALRVELQPQPASQEQGFDSEDLRKVFSEFGRVEKVHILKQGQIGVVLYSDIVAAFYAQIALNNVPLKSKNARLEVNWYELEDESLFDEQEEVKELVDCLSMPTRNSVEVDSSEGSESHESETQSVPAKSRGSVHESMESFSDMGQSGGGGGAGGVSSKFTGRFDIQIENDKQFQVARKLIGSKGSNMKRIIEMCKRGMGSEMAADAVKLRLRGKGSGFRQGPMKKESEEPLHLCISSKYYETYQQAASLVEDLLLKVYADYKRYSYERGRKVVNLQIKKVENTATMSRSRQHISFPARQRNKQPFGYEEYRPSQHYNYSYKEPAYQGGAHSFTSNPNPPSFQLPNPQSTQSFTSMVPMFSQPMFLQPATQQFMLVPQPQPFQWPATQRKHPVLSPNAGSFVPSKPHQSANQPER